jgi:hypothetical protein
MLVGTPVIAFARGSAPEVIEDGVTGYLVRTKEEMAERIRQLDRIDSVRCRARARERWTVTRMAQDYTDLYAQLLEANPRSARAPRGVSLDPRPRAKAKARAAAGTKHGAQR